MNTLYGISVKEAAEALSYISNGEPIFRWIKTKDDKKVYISIREGLQIYHLYNKNVCDLTKDEVEQYLMLMRL